MSKVVDGHVHLFRKVSDAYPRTTYGVMAEADREESAEKLIAAMDAAGVDHAIVVPLSKEDDYLREILQAFPGRFAGVGIFDHDRPDDVAGVEARLAVTLARAPFAFAARGTMCTSLARLTKSA